MKKTMSILAVGIMLFAASVPFIMAEESKADPKAGIVIIDATANNGSFETGDLAPWRPAFVQVSNSTGETYASNIIKVVKDPAFASKGNCYLSLQATGDPKGALNCARVDLPNIQGIDLEKGRNFVLSWDSRNGEKVFATPIVEFLALTKNGVVMAKAEMIAETPAVADKWVTRSVKLVMPDTLKEFNSIHLRIGFAMHPTEAGATYQGFIDNITLTQSK